MFMTVLRTPYLTQKLGKGVENIISEHCCLDTGYPDVDGKLRTRGTMWSLNKSDYLLLRIFSTDYLLEREVVSYQLKLSESY